MPRRSSSEIGAPIFGPDPPRLSPPASLGELEKRAFVDLILSLPSSHFRPSDAPLVARWAELVVQCEVAHGEMQAGGMVTSDGKPSAWFVVYQQATRSLLTVSARLRLSPSARSHATFTSHEEPPSSYYDRMALLEGPDDEAASN